ncbi:hypothetical protein ACIPX0_27845 [Streptomyces sp. NPDC090075]
MARAIRRHGSPRPALRSLVRACCSPPGGGERRPEI